MSGPARVSMKAVCEWLGIPRSTMYRMLHPRPGAGVRIAQRDRAYRHRISQTEQEHVIDRLNRDDVASLSIRQAFHHMLDRGEYVCSLASMHRIMARVGQSADRRRHTRHDPPRSRATPVLQAIAPLQVWCWDITDLKGPGRQRFKLFTMIDLYSRKVVGHRVETSESQEVAVEFINEAVSSAWSTPAVIHSDNGSSMRAGTTRDLLARLHITASYSRPRVSNDNPFIESLFKTLKYHSAFPDRFDSIGQARNWCRRFFEDYNTRHHHAGLAGHTPARIHDGSWPTQHQIWVETKQAYARQHPRRHPRAAPITHEPPDSVWINQPTNELSQTA